MTNTLDYSDKKLITTTESFIGQTQDKKITFIYEGASLWQTLQSNIIIQGPMIKNFPCP
jgi:hypothetical protein